MWEVKENQNIYSVVSGIDSRFRSNGIMPSLIGYMARFEGAALKTVEAFCKMMMNETVAQFFSEVPALNYDAARFTDCLRPYL